MANKNKIIKEVKPHGNGAHVTVSKKHIGKYAKVSILEELEGE